jgi:cytochrome P450
LLQECREQIVAIKVKRDAGIYDASRTTIFHQLLDPKATEGHVVPSVDELRDESFTLLAAASDSTGNALTVAMYETVSNASIYSRLAAELNEAFPDPAATLDFLKLEKLPYLVGIFLMYF